MVTIECVTAEDHTFSTAGYPMTDAVSLWNEMQGGISRLADVVRKPPE